MALTNFDFEEYKKRSEEIDQKYEFLFKEKENLSHKKREEEIKLMNDSLLMKGKFFILEENFYMFVKDATICTWSALRPSVNLYGMCFNMKQMSFMWDSDGHTNISWDKLKNIKEITKEEFCQAFDKFLENLKEINEKTIINYLNNNQNDEK